MALNSTETIAFKLELPIRPSLSPKWLERKTQSFSSHTSQSLSVSPMQLLFFKDSQNGKNVIDLLGDQLHLPLIPAFADPSTIGIRIIHGVDYASGASGILDDTGLLAGGVINLNQQIRNFEEITLPGLEIEMGMQSRKLLKNYLFVVGTGGNDYSFNYFLRPSDASVSVEAFTANLTNSLSKQLEKLYNLGGRKFVLMSVNPIGCYPMVKAIQRASNGSCNQDLNRAARLFNAHLKSLVNDIKPKLPGSYLVFVNSYKIIADIIKNPVSKGFEDTSNACCEVGSEGGPRATSRFERYFQYRNSPGCSSV
ncbi:hypothetical protein GH714_019159 [Hevea brasiliensis]|uniref:GDSL esterase/lipase n=1 Tax=Hevea brasiliensis TaxID=3981 RepID=A0A6A6KU95_HEVBR|nr:hypothetical protein GH714_019159 [Hevea brasiliensis]